MEGTEIIGKLIVCVENFPVTRGLGKVARGGLVVHSTRDRSIYLESLVESAAKAWVQFPALC